MSINNIKFSKLVHKQLYPHPIATNDPSFIQMNVCTSGNECHEYIISDITTDQTLGMLGGLIDRNTTLTSVGIMQFDVYEEDEEIADQRAHSSCETLVGEQVVSFCKGFVTNTSIQKLTLQNTGSLFGLLNPFFKNNHNLTELVVE